MEEQSPRGTPERAVADAFAAFRHREAARLAELTVGQPASMLGHLVMRLPETFTDSVRCLIVGRVLESRLVDDRPDGRGLIGLDCRVAGAGDEWLSVQSPRPIDGETADPAAGVAHVVFRVAHGLPGQGVVPFPPELQLATTEHVDGEWKLMLDEQSDVGLPGFRGLGVWITEPSTTDVATNDY